MNDRQMTVGEFRKQFREFAHEKTQGVIAFSDLLRHKTEKDKEIREEWIPIFAYLEHQKVPDSSTICLGGKGKNWDALIDKDPLFGKDLYIEVTLALPERAHEVRLAIAGEGLTLDQRIAHAVDYLQIPDKAVQRIKAKIKARTKAKTARKYPPNTVLLVNVLGEHSYEDDELIERWIKEIKSRTRKDPFVAIYLVEAARYKLFQIF